MKVIPQLRDCAANDFFEQFTVFCTDYRNAMLTFEIAVYFAYLVFY